MMKSIVDLMTGRFRSFFPMPAYRGWLAVAATVFGLASQLSAEDQRFVATLMGRSSLPTDAAREVFVIAGRRAGKSRFSAWVACYLACFRDYRQVLGPGERGTVIVVAPDRKQARATFRYIEAFFDADPMLRPLVVGRTRESLDLANSVTVEVHTANFKSVRGYTCLVAIVEEAAFLPSEDSATPDTELLNALRPAMATVPGALLLVISSPYARRGELYKAWREHWAKDEDPIQVFQAATRLLNSTVPSDVIERAYADDAVVAASEYGAEFRRDLEPYISREVLERSVAPRQAEKPPLAAVHYTAFVDPSGGAQDSMTIAVAHVDREKRTVLDAMREVKPPFSPEQTVAEFCRLLKSYRVTSVTGDRYAGEWPREQFRRFGVAYVPSERSKSDIYREALPLLNSGRVELLDSAALLTQLAQLERRTSRSGRDSIDHAPGAHDDLANAACGALLVASDRTRQGVNVVDLFTGVLVSGVDGQGVEWKDGRPVSAATSIEEYRASFVSRRSPTVVTAQVKLPVQCIDRPGMIDIVTPEQFDPKKHRLVP